MPMYRKLTTAAAVAALTLGLAACGGGGSDEPTATAPPPTTTPDPMPPAPTPVDVTLPETPMGHAAMAGMYSIPAGGSATSGGVMFSCAAGGEDCAVTVAEDGTATALGGDVEASLTEVAQMALDEENQAAALVARNRIIGEDSAIEGATALPARATASATSGLDRANIRVTRGAGAAARVRVTPAPAGYTPAEEAAMSNGDWAGTRLTRIVGPNTDQLVVYTDIEQPDRVQFYDFDAKATTDARYAYPGTLPTDSGGNQRAFLPTDTITPLTIGGATAGAGAFSRATLDPNEFPQPGPSAGGDVTQRYRMATAAALTHSFKGNYNGAAGTYICTVTTAGDPCIVTVAPNGAYTQTQGTWTFTPELNSLAYQGDGTFMSFGWWLRTPNNPDGAYAFEYYADGTAYAPTQDAANASTPPRGTATYSGRAAGRYVIQTVEAAGVTGGMSGEFTAAATLTANFSAQDAQGAAAPTVEGSITGFQGEMGAMSGWEVTLHRQALANDAAALGANFTGNQLDPTLPRFNGATATMGDQTAYGSWTGQFFGNQVDATGTNVNRAAPIGVGGTFHADNDAASIAGAFGANR